MSSLYNINRININNYRSARISPIASGAKNIKHNSAAINSQGSTENSTGAAGAIAEQTKESLIAQLDILNLTINTLDLSLLALVMNIRYAKWQRVKLLDAINKTNLAKEWPDLSNTLKITNKIFIYTSGVFLTIDNNAFIKISSVKGKDRNIKGIRRAARIVISSLLSFISTVMTTGNIEP